MYYILHKPRDTEEPWTELPEGIRNYPKARDTVKALLTQENPALNVRLCVGKGRNRRDILVL